jgi:hypothetical protein
MSATRRMAQNPRFGRGSCLYAREMADAGAARPPAQELVSGLVIFALGATLVFAPEWLI